MEDGEKNDRMCAKRAMMLDGEISKCFAILQGVAQRCTLSPTLSKVLIHALILAIESAQQGVKVGDDCLLYTSPSPRDLSTSRMPSSA